MTLRQLTTAVAVPLLPYPSGFQMVLFLSEPLIIRCQADGDYIHIEAHWQMITHTKSVTAKQSAIAFLRNLIILIHDITK